jgi:hypothetical protein
VNSWLVSVMTFIPQQLYGGKWSWKAIDDEIRKFLRLDSGAQNAKTGFVFHDDKIYVRKYEGHSDFYEIEPVRRSANFSFFPTGTKSL